MFVIGIDPHKASHTATVIDADERLLGELRVRADRDQRDRLLGWADRSTPRVWAVEGATGTGALLAQQLVAVGEIVLDVPPALSARVRLLDSVAGRRVLGRSLSGRVRFRAGVVSCSREARRCASMPSTRLRYRGALSSWLLLERWSVVRAR